MRKYFTIVLLAFIGWNPAHGQGPEIKPENRARSTNSARDRKPERGSPENPVVVDTQGHKETNIEREKSEKQATEARIDKDFHNMLDISTRNWTAFAAIVTALLVLVGIGGTIAAICTLRAIEAQEKRMKDQADLMQQQVSIMESQTALMQVPYQQWINIENWRASARSSHQDLVGQPDQWDQVTIKVDIANRTLFPLTIPTGEIRFTFDDGESVTFNFGTDCRITPNTHKTATILKDMSREQSRRFAAGNLSVQIRGDLSHVGVMNKREPHPINGILWPRWKNTVFEEDAENAENDHSAT